MANAISVTPGHSSRAPTQVEFDTRKGHECRSCTELSVFGAVGKTCGQVLTRTSRTIRRKKSKQVRNERNGIDSCECIERYRMQFCDWIPAVAV